MNIEQADPPNDFDSSVAPDDPDKGRRPGQPTDRRSMMSSLATAGAAIAVGGVAGAAAGGVTAKSFDTKPFRKENLVVEVALLGHTWRQGTLSNPANEADFHTPFLVEGWLYEPGTIPGDGFIPTEQGSIGRWFCRGWLVIDELRPEPHTVTNQNFYFGSIRPDALFPQNHLSSEGLEGTLTEQVPLRSVTGGAGIYMGVSGQVAQRGRGINTTIFADGTDDPAPNFIMDFELLLPNL